ncbi:hypothetical protein GOODEAATRI_031676 [Goodea atripinnis]|uniref:Uncharacterized protein n=1 Tax=Goodea atripinnis TaxID=208336 RepID=A0ABV0P182_9TELE
MRTLKFNGRSTLKPTCQQSGSILWYPKKTAEKQYAIRAKKRVLGVYGADHEFPVALTLKQWSLIENMTTLLGPFEQLTREISSQSASSVDVIPSVEALKRLLSKNMDTDAGVGTAKATLLEAVNKRFT